jgi:glycolate oxidase iron-sulfur subunit
VQYGALLEQTRDFIEENYQRSPWQVFLRRVIIERVFPVPARMKLAIAPARLARSLQLHRLLPAKLREPLSLLPSRITADHSPEFSPSDIQPAKGTVGFLRGCVMSVMFGGTNASTIRLLNAAGFDVITPRAQACCGALFAHSGRLNLAREAACKNVAAFGAHSLSAIITNAAGCGSTLKEYGHLLEHDPDAPSASSFGAKVRDLSEFLVAHGFAEHIFRPPPDRVTYHDACHLAHAQRITNAPRALVKAVAGANYVELPEADVCCGSAGTYNLTEPEMAARLQSRKLQNILATGASTIVTSNPGCIMQIQSGLENAAPGKFRVVHLADFLAGALADK